MKFRHHLVFLGIAAGAFMGLSSRLPGQEIGSPPQMGTGGVSQTGETLAEQLKQSDVNQSYNLRIGPVNLRVETDLTFSFNDNISLTKTGRVSDIIVTPMGIVHASWVVSDLNTLKLNVGIGYEAYLLNSQYNNLVLAPDSQASFNFFAGDVAINLQDTFSYQQDPTAVAQLSNQARLNRFLNDAGVTAQWDLNDIMVDLAYDHSNLWVMDSIYNYLTNQSDTFAPKLTIKVDESISTGVNASVSYTQYQQSFENNFFSESAGPFVNATLSNNLSLTGQFGGFFSQYQHGGGNGDNSSIASYYGSLGINNQLNTAWSQALTAGREFLPGLTSNYTDRIYANYSDSWQATKEIALNSSIFWENLTDSDSTFRETSDRYGVNLGLNDTLSPHANLSFNYQFLLKDSDPSYLSYIQNVGTVEMVYNF